jgi:hypothetical protein
LGKTGHRGRDDDSVTDGFVASNVHDVAARPSRRHMHEIPEMGISGTKSHGRMIESTDVSDRYRALEDPVPVSPGGHTPRGKLRSSEIDDGRTGRIDSRKATLKRQCLEWMYILAA